MFKPFALLSCDASHDPTLTISHWRHLYHPPARLSVSLPATLNPFMISLRWRLPELLQHTLELLSLCTVMTSYLTRFLSTLNVSYSHYSDDDITMLCTLAFATFLYYSVTFHSAPSYAAAQFCHPSLFFCHRSSTAQIPLFVSDTYCFMTCTISKL